MPSGHSSNARHSPTWSAGANRARRPGSLGKGRAEQLPDPSLCPTSGPTGRCSPSREKTTDVDGSGVGRDRSSWCARSVGVWVPQTPTCRLTNGTLLGHRCHVDPSAAMAWVKGCIPPSDTNRCSIKAVLVLRRGRGVLVALDGSVARWVTGLRPRCGTLLRALRRRGLCTRHREW